MVRSLAVVVLVGALVVLSAAEGAAQESDNAALVERIIEAQRAASESMKGSGSARVKATVERTRDGKALPVASFEGGYARIEAMPLRCLCGTACSPVRRAWRGLFSAPPS